MLKQPELSLFIKNNIKIERNFFNLRRKIHRIDI